MARALVGEAHYDRSRAVLICVDEAADSRFDTTLPSPNQGWRRMWHKCTHNILTEIVAFYPDEHLSRPKLGYRQAFGLEHVQFAEAVDR